MYSLYSSFTEGQPESLAYVNASSMHFWLAEDREREHRMLGWTFMNSIWCSPVAMMCMQARQMHCTCARAHTCAVAALPCLLPPQPSWRRASASAAGRLTWCLRHAQSISQQGSRQAALTTHRTSLSRALCPRSKQQAMLWRREGNALLRAVKGTPIIALLNLW